LNSAAFPPEQSRQAQDVPFATAVPAIVMVSSYFDPEPQIRSRQAQSPHSDNSH
jgi:hypothetical protein